MSRLLSPDQSDFNIGETVYYVLPKGGGRPTDWYLEGTVLSINKMVRIQPKSMRMARNVMSKFLVRNPPEGAVIK